ncbi:hypothetical protein KY343_06575 [Candidatus Woesearchaeota archaeon]|nr:hypothetical protein [Candidatus Woesearchaeota archaeon]
MSIINNIGYFVEKIPVICALINTRRTDILRSQEDRLKEGISQTPYKHTFDQYHWDAHTDERVFELAQDDGKRFHEIKSELEKNLKAARDYRSRTEGNWWEPVFGDLEDSFDRLLTRIETTHDQRTDIIRRYTTTRSKNTRDLDELKVLDELAIRSIPEAIDVYDINMQQAAQNIRDILDGEMLEAKRTLKEEMEFLAKHKEYTEDKDPFDYISLSPEDIEKARQTYLRELSNPRSDLQKRLSDLQKDSGYGAFDEDVKSLIDVVELLAEFSQLPGYDLTDDHKKEVICTIYDRIKNEVIESPGDKERTHGINEFYAKEIIGLIERADQLNSELKSKGLDNYEEMKKEAVQHACEVYKENFKREGFHAGAQERAMDLLHRKFKEFISYSYDEFLSRDNPKDDPASNKEAFYV